MLIETYNQALLERDRILHNLDKTQLTQLLHNAGDLWVDYKPDSKEANVSGIDSSWNLIPYQGFYLYAVDAVSILSDESFPSKQR